MKRIAALLIVIVLLIALALFAAREAAEPGADMAPSTPTTTVAAQGVQTFSSAALGISFQYDASKAAVKEEGNDVYVYSLGTSPEKGQHIERFAKDSNESFEAAIRASVLRGYSSTTCAVAVTQSNKYQGGYFEAEISYPAPTDANQPPLANASLCNDAYDKTNGLRFFLYDSNHPDRFYFFDIGQYAIPAAGSEPWQDTVTID